MKLSYVKGWEGEEQLITDQPTEAFISEFVNSLDWNDFNAVHLAKNDQNWINVSGNISPDGLSIVYEEGGEQHVAGRAPSSIQELIDVILSYYSGDEQFKNFDFDSYSEAEISMDDQRWLDEYERKYRRRRKLNKRAKVVIISIALVFFAYLYLTYTGEIKFIGKASEQTIATVTEIKWRPRRPQLVIYQFDYQGQTYTGHFKGRLKNRAHRPQDKVRIKFLINDPTVSKWLATLKRTP